MKCVRCHKEMDTSRAEMNALCYGVNFYACPHCGMPYNVYRPETVCITPTSGGGRKEDDWGNPVVSDYDYYTELNGEDNNSNLEE